MLENIQATSKTSLKLQCLQVAEGDLKKASELYDYLVAGIDLPDFDPVKPTLLEQTRDTANGILDWFSEHKDTIAEGYDFIRGFTSKKTPKAPLPPINN